MVRLRSTPRSTMPSVATVTLSWYDARRHQHEIARRALVDRRLDGLGVGRDPDRAARRGDRRRRRVLAADRSRRFATRRVLADGELGVLPLARSAVERAVVGERIRILERVRVRLARAEFAGRRTRSRGSASRCAGCGLRSPTARSCPASMRSDRGLEHVVADVHGDHRVAGSSPRCRRGQVHARERDDEGRGDQACQFVHCVARRRGLERRGQLDQRAHAEAGPALGEVAVVAGEERGARRCRGGPTGDRRRRTPAGTARR